MQRYNMSRWGQAPPSSLSPSRLQEPLPCSARWSLAAEGQWKPQEDQAWRGRKEAALAVYCQCQVTPQGKAASKITQFPQSYHANSNTNSLFINANTHPHKHTFRTGTLWNNQVNWSIWKLLQSTSSRQTSWFLSIILSTTPLSIKHSSLFKLNNFSRMVSIYKMNKVQALYSRLFKPTEKTVSKLCFENLQNKQYHHSCSEDGKKSSQETPSQLASRALTLSFKWVNFLNIKNP